MFAVRNIRLCTKDCLCLYVCPTHATDTENGQVDWSKCIGCGACAKACPSGAISMVPEKMPPQRVKVESVVDSLNELVQAKVEQEKIAAKIKNEATCKVAKQFAEALRLSNHIMAEDIIREAGYMLPQSQNAIKVLTDISKNETAVDFPKEAVDKLLNIFQLKGETK